MKGRIEVSCPICGKQLVAFYNRKQFLWTEQLRTNFCSNVISMVSKRGWLYPKITEGWPDDSRSGCNDTMFIVTCFCSIECREKDGIQDSYEITFPQ